MTGIRNLTRLVQFKIFVPDVTLELAEKNCPWLMRLDLPADAEFQEVVSIEQPNLLGLGGAMRRAVGYLYRVPMDSTCPVLPRFITSVFTGADVPWPNGDRLLDDHDLWCTYLGSTVTAGIPLVHLETVVQRGESPVEAADELEAEVSKSYQMVPPKEYELDKKLLMLLQSVPKTEVETGG